MKRPTFFLSSTIFDFQDLRSALKYYLEEQGCKVLSSEFNDFPKPLDKHSYQACLDTIHAADYFILLIGSRVGGWYDEASKISITQREYREAYSLSNAGKLKLLNFVRADVWRAKEDRRELVKHLETFALDEELKKAVANYPSKNASDAEFISAFIAEVGRSRETKVSTRTGSSAPSGNWIHTFTGFREIVDAINGAIFSSTPMEDITLKRLLRREVREFLAQSLVKFKAGSVHSPRSAVEAFHAAHPITKISRMEERTDVRAKLWDRIASMSIHLHGLQLHPVVLSSAVSLPTFLTFDLSKDTYVETPVYEALLSLLSEVRRLTKANQTDTLKLIYEHSPKNQPRRGDIISVNTMNLVALLYLLDRWINVIELSRSLLRFLDGEAFVMPSLRPSSPIQGMQEMLAEETPTFDEINAFISEQ